MSREQPIPAEFLAQYDAERAAILRRRAVWYSITILALVAFSVSVTVYEIAVGIAFTGGDSASSADILTDSLYTLIFGGALVYFARRVRPRTEVVRAFQWVVAVAGVTAIAVTPLVMNTSWVPGATLDHTPETDFAQALASLMTVFVLHFLASVFVALSAREGLAPLVPVLAAFAGWVVFVSVGSAAQRVGLILISPLAGLPGLALSWWRYRSFAERFNARAIQKRYTEVTRELTDARRVHEALFPPPLSRGPVRVRYHYEPMREIGGDFLFVRPLSFPPSAPAGPVLAVLIDVTGHGIAAALAVNRLHDELGRLCVGRIAGPREVILALNSFIAGSLAPTGMFATAIAIMVEPGSQACVRWAGAGHPPAFLRTADGRVERLESTGPMLGVLDAELFECDEGRAEMPPGATVIAYTDGVNEAKDSGGAMLGLAAVEALIARGPGAGAPPAEPATLADALAAAVRSHRADQPTDDTLIVELTPQAEATEPEAQARGPRPGPGRVP
jgi:serine phosphatase RsbU (regulator of sigma subunit)